MFMVALISLEVWTNTGIRSNAMLGNSEHGYWPGEQAKRSSCTEVRTGLISLQSVHAATPSTSASADDI